MKLAQIAILATLLAVGSADGGAGHDVYLSAGEGHGEKQVINNGQINYIFGWNIAGDSIDITMTLRGQLFDMGWAGFFQ